MAYETISVNGLYRPASWNSGTKHHCSQFDQPRKRTRVRTNLTQFRPKSLPLPGLLQAMEHDSGSLRKLETVVISAGWYTGSHQIPLYIFVMI